MTTLAHAVLGKGSRGLVLLHGFLGAGRNLGALARGLAESDEALTILTPDLTGHGASPPLPPGANTATLAADVLETARAAGLAGPLALVGHSLGARVALRAARRDGAGIARIVMLDMSPSPLPAGGETQAIADALAAAPASAPDRGAMRDELRHRGLAPGIVDWLVTNLVRDGAGVRWRIDRRALAEFRARIAGEDLWDAVEGPRPYAVHCLRGARSDRVTEADARRLVAAGCPVETVEGAGHFLHVERPAEVRTRVRRALGDRR